MWCVCELSSTDSDYLVVTTVHRKYILSGCQHAQQRENRNHIFLMSEWCDDNALNLPSGDNWFECLRDINYPNWEFSSFFSVPSRKFRHSTSILVLHPHSKYILIHCSLATLSYIVHFSRVVKARKSVTRIASNSVSKQNESRMFFYENSILNCVFRRPGPEKITNYMSLMSLMRTAMACLVFAAAFDRMTWRHYKGHSSCGWQPQCVFWSFEILSKADALNSGSWA
jgi:hypothetical protein